MSTSLTKRRGDPRRLDLADAWGWQSWQMKHLPPASRQNASASTIGLIVIVVFRQPSLRIVVTVRKLFDEVPLSLRRDQGASLDRFLSALHAAEAQRIVLMNMKCRLYGSKA
jgi:hypothetical protein